MSDPTETTLDDHDPLAHDILDVLEAFIDEIGHRGCTGHFANVITGKRELHGRHLIQKPERFIEDHLVFPILTGPLGLSIRPQPKQYAPPWPRKGGVPDFCVTSIPIQQAMQNDLRVFGEVKRPKHIDTAEQDMEDYLKKEEDLHALGILSDGLTWQLWVRPKGESVDDLENPYAEASLKQPLKTVRSRNNATAPYQPHEVRNSIDTEAFSNFTLDGVLSVLETEFGVAITG